MMMSLSLVSFPKSNVMMGQSLLVYIFYIVLAWYIYTLMHGTFFDLQGHNERYLVNLYVQKFLDLIYVDAGSQGCIMRGSISTQNGWS